MNTQIKVGAMDKHYTAYDKDMNIIGADGVEVRVILHWDEHDGYEYTWLDLESRFINAPAWAENFEEEHNKSLGSFLDSLEAHSLVTL
jgi:hypothetical protein